MIEPISRSLIRLKLGFSVHTTCLTKDFLNIFKENYKPNYVDEGEVYPGEKGQAEVEILGKEFTSFLVLIGIYFPSVTGLIMLIFYFFF